MNNSDAHDAAKDLASDLVRRGVLKPIGKLVKTPRRVKIRVTLTVYSYAKPRERLDAAAQRIALASEMAINNSGEFRADVKHYRQQEPE